MIGQKNLKKEIDWMCESHSFPRFTIITGEQGSEKIELARYIAQKLEFFIFEPEDNKIDMVRAVIEEAYKITSSMVYIFNDADDMSVSAKNALLKVTEEPPNNAYFILILDDINNTLDTIRSRAITLQMEPYSKQELLDFAQLCGGMKVDYIDLCSTPGDVELLYKMHPEEFYNYVQKVIDNIGTVNGANSFKIADKIALKDEPDKYDLRMFWRTCCKLFYNKAKTVDYIPYVKAVDATSNSLKKLSIKGVNKQMLFDEWILKVREALK